MSDRDMGICTYNSKYDRVKRTKVVKRYNLDNRRIKVVDGKSECFEVYRKSKGIKIKDMAEVIGMTENEFRTYFNVTGISQVVIDIVYILTGDDISYMKKEWV